MNTVFQDQNRKSRTNCCLFITIDLHFLPNGEERIATVGVHFSLDSTFYVINPMVVCVCVFYFFCCCSALKTMDLCTMRTLVRTIYEHYVDDNKTHLTNSFSCLDGWWCYLLCCAVPCLALSLPKILLLPFSVFYAYGGIRCVYFPSFKCVRACVPLAVCILYHYFHVFVLRFIWNCIHTHSIILDCYAVSHIVLCFSVKLYTILNCYASPLLYIYMYIMLWLRFVPENSFTKTAARPTNDTNNTVNTITHKFIILYPHQQTDKYSRVLLCFIYRTIKCWGDSQMFCK